MDFCFSIVSEVEIRQLKIDKAQCDKLQVYVVIEFTLLSILN